MAVTRGALVPTLRNFGVGVSVGHFLWLYNIENGGKARENNMSQLDR